MATITHALVTQSVPAGISAACVCGTEIGTFPGSKRSEAKSAYKTHKEVSA